MIKDYAVTAQIDESELRTEPGSRLVGQTTVPGDKSISHRVVMLGALAKGTTRVHGWLPAGDTLATLNAVRALGIPVDHPEPHTLLVHGGPLRAPTAPLNLANAGTGLRLLAGMLAGQPFASTLDGSEQLRRRPMRRITDPLRLMGADITTTDNRPPLHIKPARLSGICYEMPIPSGQVKSALLLAGLFAEGPTTVIEPGPARDHTERLLRAMGAAVSIDSPAITLTPGYPLQAVEVTVPGDFSSAAFLLVAASILPGSRVRLDNISLNPTRTGLLDVLQQMGAALTVTPVGESGGDPVGRIVVQSTALGNVSIGGDTVVRMIDEFPILMVAALCAQGRTKVRDARELRIKESDRIAVMAAELRKMGAVIEEYDDGFAIKGPQPLKGAVLETHDDHRIGMSLAVAGLVADGATVIQDAGCIADSFPGFAPILRALGAKMR